MLLVVVVLLLLLLVVVLMVLMVVVVGARDAHALVVRLERFLHLVEVGIRRADL